jgi:allantoate deiminase
MAEAGMDTWVDAVGNVHGRVKCITPNIPAQLIGSHYDTVVDGGKYDGALGIISGIAAVKTLLLQAAVAKGILQPSALEDADNVDIRTLLTRTERMSLLIRPIEVVGFSDEEGIRFTSTFLGSSAIAGRLMDSGLLARKDGNGLTLSGALAEAGFDASSDTVRRLAIKPELVHNYVEVHIEQGPQLEDHGLPLGLVQAIAGQVRLVATIQGEQGHAGTVPMKTRRDALAAAAEAIQHLETLCASDDDTSLVCTVGSIAIHPNASNVIPREVVFTMDIRTQFDDNRKVVVEKMEEFVKEMCERRRTVCDIELKHEVPARAMDAQVHDALREAIIASAPLSTIVKKDCSSSSSSSCEIEYDPPSLVSGAGHDALLLAETFNVGMLFVRCKGGVSHSPLESASEDDVATATSALLVYLQQQTLST